MTASFSLRQFARNQYDRLRQLRDAPQAVAGGVAIGMFWGFTPLVGFKTLLSVLFAWTFRCSKISAAIAVCFPDILTPILPVIFRWEYDFGFWILSHPHHFPKRLTAEDEHLKYWLHLKTLEVLWPIFVGSLLLAVPSALISYWIVEKSLKRYQRVHHRRTSPP